MFYGPKWVEQNESKALNKQLILSFARSYFQAQFLAKAVEILCNSHEQLMLSYIFTYFTEPWPEKGIYEMNQNDLKLVADELWMCLTADDINIDEVRNRAQ